MNSLLQLIVTVCAINNPGVCEDKRLTLDDQQMSMMACMVCAQARLAQWVVENPEWRVVRWRCDYPAV